MGAAYRASARASSAFEPPGLGNSGSACLVQRARQPEGRPGSLAPAFVHVLPHTPAHSTVRGHLSRLGNNKEYRLFSKPPSPPPPPPLRTRTHAHEHAHTCCWLHVVALRCTSEPVSEPDPEALPMPELVTDWTKQPSGTARRTGPSRIRGPSRGRPTTPWIRTPAATTDQI